jgi:predicted DsbA family dithiol-disulfide isomerase
MEAAFQLARAQPSTAHLDFEVTWAPFQLDESLPVAGVSKIDRYTEKFGARFAAMIPTMQAVGRALSPPVEFSYGGLVANTMASHVLLEAALAEGGPELQDRVVEKFFEHYFEKEGNLGDFPALVRMAAEAGMAEAAAAALLEGGSAGAAAARAAVAKAELATRRKYRVTGVPFFIFDEKIAFSGAQEPAAFLDVFEKLAE